MNDIYPTYYGGRIGSLDMLGYEETKPPTRPPLTNRPRLRTRLPPHSYGNQRLQRQFDGLLMMGMMVPETCRAVSVRQSSKVLRLIVASSWVFYLRVLQSCGCKSHSSPFGNAVSVETLFYQLSNL